MTRSATNPLLDHSGLPRFEEIEPEHVVPAIEEVLARAESRIERALAEPEPRWEGLGRALAEADVAVRRTFAPVRHLHAVADRPELRKAYEEALARITAFATRRAQDRRIDAGLARIAAAGGLPPGAARWIELERLRMRLAGVHLDEAARAEIARLRLRLAELGTRFETQLLDATDAFALDLEDPAALEGLPEHIVAAARAASPDGRRWRLTLKLPVYLAVMRFAASRELRERLYRAYVTRATEPPVDNGPVMEEILAARHAHARILGYPSYAHQALVDRMAREPERVFAFLDALAAAARPAARRELEELEAFARAEGGPRPLEPWDVPYWSERLRAARLGVAERELQDFFPLPRVLEGLFETAERLYGVRFEEREGVQRWDPCVRYLEVLDAATGEPLGGLYLDLVARPGKRGGAWMDEAIPRHRAPDGTLVRPVAFLTCNFPPETPEGPPRLAHGEVATLFHEAGHCLHHLLTEVEVPGVAGLRGVPWDAIEVPSQLHERFARVAEGVARIARHHRTGEPPPPAMLEAIERARTFQAGMQAARQLELAWFDMALHARDPSTLGPDGIHALALEANARYGAVPAPAWNRFENGFSHIFAGGYAAGYYSYKWAEVIAADAFARFRERGTFDPETGRRFRAAVLARGGSEPFEALVRAFLGRDARLEALLEECGLLPAGPAGRPAAADAG